jgi:outer membrane protein assembly factor BamB
VVVRGVMLGFAVAGWFVGLCSVAYAQPANSPWPQYGRDVQHTGWCPYIGPTQPGVKWRVELETNPLAVLNSYPTIGTDGTIYYGTGRDTGFLHAISPDGYEKWRLEISGCVSTAPVLDVNGHIYFPGNRGGLFCADTDGNLLWAIGETNPGGGSDVYTDCVVGPDGTIYTGCIVGSSHAYYCALNPDGSERWRKPLSGWPAQYPAAIGQNGLIYIADESDLLALWPDGGEAWRYPIGDYMGSPTVVGPDGTVYAIGDSGWLWALAADGGLKWKRKLGLNLGIASPIVSPAGQITVAIGAEIYRFSPDGDLLWTARAEGSHGCFFPLGSMQDGSGVTYVIYRGWPGDVAQAYGDDGQLLWEIPSPDGQMEGGFALSPDGTLYFGTANDLFAVCHVPLPGMTPFVGFGVFSIAMLLRRVRDRGIPC